MKFLKFLVQLFLVLTFVIAAYQIAQYWLGLSYYPFVSSLFLVFVHGVVLGGIGWAFVSFSKIKV